MVTQSPRRPVGFYESVLREWRVHGILKGLTDSEAVLLGAQFTGLAIANTAGDSTLHDAQIEVAIRAMRTAYVGRIAVREGFGRPVPTSSDL